MYDPENPNRSAEMQFLSNCSKRDHRHLSFIALRVGGGPPPVDGWVMRRAFGWSNFREACLVTSVVTSLSKMHQFISLHCATGAFQPGFVCVPLASKLRLFHCPNDFPTVLSSQEVAFVGQPETLGA